METAHTFCYNVGSTHNIASESVVTLPKSTMNCPDASNWDKLNAFNMSVAFATRQIYAFFTELKKMKDGAMFIDYFSIDFSCFVPQGEWNRWNTRNKIGQLFSGHTPNRMCSNGLSCSTCSACFTHSAERNGTRCRNQGRFCSATVSICIGCIWCLEFRSVQTCYKLIYFG